MAANNSSTNKFEPREYQLELLEAAKQKNIIVCLGTGTGKTFISIKLIEHLAREDDILRPFSEGAKRTFFLVNSVPLVFQQAQAIRDHTALSVKEFCGEMGVDFWLKSQWLENFQDNHVLVMTHQIYLDLIQHARYGFSLLQANLLVFDECHHANKNHPFKKIMDCFADVPRHQQRGLPKILGLTASVVGKKVKPYQIGDEIKKLERTMRSICKTAQDPYIVEKYGAKPKEIMRSYSSSNHLDSVAMFLESEFHSVLNPLEAFLENMKVLKERGGSQEVIKKELDVARAAVRECLSALDEIGIWAAYEVSRMLVEDLEKRSKKVSSGLSPHAKTAGLLLQTTVTSLRELRWRYDEFSIANMKGKEKIQQEYLKPKVKELLNLFSKYKGDQSKMCSIVFVRRRYAACVISKLINALASSESDEYRHLSSDFVTGHGSELPGVSATEMNFKKQQETLTKFRTGTFNVLVGTSVVEEGVDIPKCNLVVMFDFPQNYRAFVQSRGRGRAKDAKYVMLVARGELQGKRLEQEMYQSVDDHLRELCQADRDGPTEEEINEEVNEYPLEKYFTKKGGKLDMGNSVNRLYRYCSKLPCDRFTRLKPIFTIHDADGMYQCFLKMPGNSHITGIIKGEPMENKEDARRAVAYKACIELHEQHGALDDHLLPVESSSESESDEDDVVDGSSQHKTGTKKRVRLHRVKTSDQLYGHGTINNTKKLYVYAINMEFCEVYNTIKKRLWDRKNVSLGIITCERLPVDQLLPFHLYNDIGKLEVTLDERCQLKTVPSRRHLNIFDWFHKFIFAETLELKLGAFKNYGCRIILLNCDNATTQTTRAVSTSSSIINFDAMETLRKNATESDGRLTSNPDLWDSVVIQDYLGPRKQGHHMVKSVTDKSALSAFPDLEVAATFQEYHEGKYQTKIKNLSQSLLEVIHHSRNIDCRTNRYGNPSRSKEMFLIPETLLFRTSPQSLTLRALFLPAILFRVDSFVSMIELRDTISTEIAANSAYIHNTQESPRKRCKLMDIGSAGKNLHSSLVKYFSPFERDSSVPLLQLLEAVTCARSNDDFSLERLEMLGDSFLKMAVSIHVFSHKNHKDEGKLTKYRTRQISNKNLLKLAMEKDLPKFIKYIGFSKPKETWRPPGFASCKQVFVNGNLSSSSDDFDDVTDSAIRDRNHVIDDAITQEIPDKSVADSMEALIGAHFIHCGYIGALRFMTWLGVDVFHEENTTDEALNNNGRRVSPTPQDLSKYANYPLQTLEIPADEDRARYKEILAKQTKEMASFERKIGYTFKNKVLLLEAFTHPSYSDNTITGSYQRLEFLGDAILDFLVTQHIYNNCKKDLTPGQLTDLRSALVNNNIFAIISIENNYHKYIKEYSPHLFSTIGNFVKGVELYKNSLGTNKVSPDPYVIAVQSGSSDVECIEAPKPLGDVFESVAGAIFLDSGLDVLEVWRVCYPMLKKFIDEYSKNVPKNPMRRVNELDVSAEYSRAEILEDGRVSSVLKFKGREYKGFGINKRNAKLSASYRALKTIDDKK